MNRDQREEESRAQGPSYFLFWTKVLLFKEVEEHPPCC